MKPTLIGAVLTAVCAFAVPVAAQQQAQVRLNLSPAGEAVAKRYLGTPDPKVKVLAERMGEVLRQQRALVAAPKFDLVRLAALLRQREQLQGQMMRVSNDRLLEMLRQLSEADRVAFARGMSSPTMVPAPGK